MCGCLWLIVFISLSVLWVTRDEIIEAVLETCSRFGGHVLFLCIVNFLCRKSTLLCSMNLCACVRVCVCVDFYVGCIICVLRSKHWSCSQFLWTEEITLYQHNGNVAVPLGFSSLKNCFMLIHLWMLNTLYQSLSDGFFSVDDSHVWLGHISYKCSNGLVWKMHNCDPNSIFLPSLQLRCWLTSSGGLYNISNMAHIRNPRFKVLCVEYGIFALVTGVSLCLQAWQPSVFVFCFHLEDWGMNNVDNWCFQD